MNLMDTAAFHVETIVALITLAGVMLTGIWAYSARNSSHAANRAVNNRGSNAPIIYDMVRDTHERVKDISNKVDELSKWKAGFEGSSLTDGAAVERLVTKVDKIENDIIKYGCPVATNNGAILCTTTKKD